ncbi:copper resistance CopC family protein [Actinophytocola sp.]|uniref:copper resistance CopC family protein n=1 Tax=Actinophytocola sp. TaxID=1872138 RepID=UPI002D6BFB06|nr:copper resistance CopC family protein [Actinophytocola sp.]HYQ65404.1 copper resistance CopC family protein [Actinophytocola sp.]
MRKLLAVLALTGLGLFALAGTASAHNSLVSSNPAENASVAAGPGSVELTFDQPVQEGKGLNTVAVTGPDGKQWQGGPARVDSNVVSAPVRELGPKGVYTIGYRIVSADGHPVSGQVTFTLTEAGNGTPAPADANVGSVPGTTSGDDSGLPIWVWLVGAAVLLGAGLFVALRIGGKQE